MEWFGGIEAGGTKFNCIVAHDPENIIAEKTIPTKTPDLTLPEVVHFFKDTENKHNISISRMAIASFGPVNLDPSDPGYGSITSTPKPGWRNTPLVTVFKEYFSIPIAFDTDVNGAAIGEGKWGAGAGFTDFIYLTVGTGIGGGAIINGLPVHGLIHPEMGHMLIKHDLGEDPFEGSCPYHKDCLEGLAAGPAIARRWGIPAHELPPEHPAWDLEARYISQAVHNLCLVNSPQRVILGGGVMKVPGVIEKICNYVKTSLNGYVDSTQLTTQAIDSFIVPPALGDRAGSLGAIAMAILNK